MKPTILLVALVALLGGCAPVGPTAPSPEIRVVNRSQENYAKVIVRFPAGEVDYGALAAGAASRYESVDEAYRYAAVDVLVGDERLTMQPIDFVGETPLGQGRYSYAIGLAPGGDQLTLELETD